MSPPNGVPIGSDTTHYLPAAPDDQTMPYNNPPKDPSEYESPFENPSNQVYPKLMIVEDPLEDSGADDALDDDAEVVVPPDGGWGWVVVGASFMCNMIVDGTIFSFGQFIPYLMVALKATETEVSLVGSLMSGFYLMAGPFASALANRFGFSLVAVAGSVLAAAAFALSYFAGSVAFLYPSYGILGGIGFGLIYVPSIITVGFYFERWRALATGIGVCGSGIGTFLFAPLSETLLSKYGWKITFLVQGSIVLTCVIFGLMFRPLKPKKVKDIDVDQKNQPELVLEPSKLMNANHKSMEHLKMTSSNISINHLKSGVNNNSNYPTVSEMYNSNSKLSNTDEKQKRLSVPVFQGARMKRGDSKPLLQTKSSTPQIGAISRSTAHLAMDGETVVNRPMYRDDIFFTGSLNRLPQYTSRTSLGYNMSVTRLPTKADIEEEKGHGKKLSSEAVKRTLATMLDFSLFKSPTFILLAVSGFFTMMGFFVPFMFLSDRATSSGMDPKTAVFLVSVIGIANTIGRVLCGLLSSFPGVNALLVNNIALTVGGIATIASGLSMTAEYQFTYSVVFGFAIACFASLRSIIVVDLMGLERLTNVFGLLLLFQGIAATMGAPIAGLFKNLLGEYNSSFYVSGGFILLSAFISYPLNYVNRKEIEKERRAINVPV